MSLEYFLIRLTDPLFKGFSGYLGPIAFEGGVSMEPIHRNLAAGFSVGFPCEAISSDGRFMFEVKPGHIPASEDMLRVGSDALISAKAERHRDEPAEIRDAEEGLETCEEKTAVEPAGESQVETYTREALEAVADKSGLPGLRVIGESLGVKAKSIPDLIEKILSAQE